MKVCINTSLNFYANPVMWEEPTETQNYFELVQSTAFSSHFFNKDLMDSTNLVWIKNQLKVCGNNEFYWCQYFT